MTRPIYVSALSALAMISGLLTPGPAFGARSCTINNGSGLLLSDGIHTTFEADGQAFGEAGDTMTAIRLKLDGGMLPDGWSGISGSGPWDWQASSTPPFQYRGQHRLGARATLRDSNQVNHAVDVPVDDEIIIQM